MGDKSLAPKFCPIDGSKLLIVEDSQHLICEAENHAWNLELGKEPEGWEFYTLELTGY